MIHEIEPSKDGLIRKVVVKYRNNRFTTRAVRELVLIHPIDEVHIMEELVRMATTGSIVLLIDRIRNVEWLE